MKLKRKFTEPNVTFFITKYTSKRLKKDVLHRELSESKYIRYQHIRFHGSNC